MRYENLPIFRSSLALCAYIEIIVKGFEKYHKYTIGSELRNETRALLYLIHRANLSSDANRAQYLIRLRDKSEDVKVVLYLAKEIRAFKAFTQFENSVKLASQVAKQAQGWLNAGV